MHKHIKNQTVAIVLLLTAVLFLSPPVLSENLDPSIMEALEKGDTANAIILLNGQIELDPSYHLNYYYLGLIDYTREKYQSAAEKFDMALSKKKKHYESLYYQGLSYLALGKIEKAEEAFKEGLKKDKDNKHRFEDGMGLIYMARKNYPEADRSFRQAIVENPDEATYHIHLGDANFYQGIPALAILEYEKALAMDTASLEVYYHWAEACLEMRDFPCALEKLKVVLSKDSTYAPAWNRAAGIYFKAARSSRDREERKNRFMETIGAYRKYLDLSKAQPDSATVRIYYEMAMSFVEINGFEDAAENFEKVLSIPMEPKDIYFYYGKSLWRTKDYEKSGDMLLKHIDWVKKQDEGYSSSIDDYELNQLLGDSYYYRTDKDFSTAIEYYKKSLEDQPEQKRLVYNVAVAYNILKSYDQALEYYDKRIAMGIDDKSAVNFMRAGYCALNVARRSDGDEEEDIEEDASESLPADTTDYYRKAVDYFLQFLEYEPDDYKILSEVAYTYLYTMADCANGVKYYEKLNALGPDSCLPKRSLGYAYFGGVCNKSYTKSLQYLLDAYNCVSAKGECEDIALTLWVAQCYHLRAAEKMEKQENANDDFKAAFNWYGKVLKCEPNHPDAKKGQDDVQFEFVE